MNDQDFFSQKSAHEWNLFQQHNLKLSHFVVAVDALQNLTATAPQPVGRGFGRFSSAPKPAHAACADLN